MLLAERAFVDCLDVTHEILHRIPDALADFLSSHKDGGLLVLHELRFTSSECSFGTGVLRFTGSERCEQSNVSSLRPIRRVPSTYMVLSIDMITDAVPELESIGFLQLYG